MKIMLRGGRMLVAALVGVALAGCDSSESFAPRQPAAGFAEFQADVLSQAESNGIDIDGESSELQVSMSMGGGDRTFVRGAVGDESVEAVIGAEGGVLNLGPHWLLVPSGAVRGDVLFRMTPISDGTFHVDLTATRVNSPVENDVGMTGFRRAVLLGFQYGDAAVDPASLTVAWLTSQGRLVSQPTYIFQDHNGDEWAVGVLRHFSGYVLVAN